MLDDLFEESWLNQPSARAPDPKGFIASPLDSDPGERNREKRESGASRQETARGPMPTTHHTWAWACAACAPTQQPHRYATRVRERERRPRGWPRGRPWGARKTTRQGDVADDGRNCVRCGGSGARCGGSPPCLPCRYSPPAPPGLTAHPTLQACNPVSATGLCNTQDAGLQGARETCHERANMGQRSGSDGGRPCGG